MSPCAPARLRDIAGDRLPVLPNPKKQKKCVLQRREMRQDFPTQSVIKRYNCVFINFDKKDEMKVEKRDVPRENTFFFAFFPGMT